MTYNVFSGTLNPTLSNLLITCTSQYVAIVYSSPCKRDQSWTAAFDTAVLTNEYRIVGKWIRIRMLYSKCEFFNFV